MNALIILAASMGADPVPRPAVDYTPGIRKSAAVSYCPGRPTVGKPAPSVVKAWEARKLPPKKEIVGYRTAHGHTHTCPSCGVTWDHEANESHNCELCGTYQNRVDNRTLPVAVIRTVPQIAYVAPESTILPQAVQYTLSGQIVAPAQSYATGCGPTGCSGSSSGLFPRLRRR